MVTGGPGLGRSEGEALGATEPERGGAGRAVADPAVSSSVALDLAWEDPWPSPLGARNHLDPAKLGAPTTALCATVGGLPAPVTTNPLEQVNGEIKRRSDVVGIFSNEAAVTRLIGALLLEQNDGWATQRARYMTLETIALLSDDHSATMPALES